MEFEVCDFTRNPVVENGVFFLQSKCAPGGFSMLARSLEELSSKKSSSEHDVVPPNTADNHVSMRASRQRMPGHRCQISRRRVA